MFEFLISIVTEVIVATCSPDPCIEVKKVEPPPAIAQQVPKAEPAPISREDYE